MGNRLEDTLSVAELEILSKLNIRALKLNKIYEHFKKKKVGIDKNYLDTLPDKELDEILKTHIDGKAQNYNTVL